MRGTIADPGEPCGGANAVPGVSGPGDGADPALVEAWVFGRDESAFARLAVRHAALMRRIAASVAGQAARRDPGLVEDIVQEALIRLVDALGRWRGDAPLVSFIAALTRKTALGEFRKLRRRRAREGDDWTAGQGTDPSSGADRFRPENRHGEGDPARVFEREELARAAAALLDLFREPDRSVLYLRDAEGFTYAEIAAAVGLNEGTVKSKLARARMRLRTEFARYENQGGGT
ncbi:MAG: RNA polymerase sigma factor [Spirochaetes bacterium]|nr:RNA polymerase sigma factor [Spirochaetota bacterium]